MRVDKRSGLLFVLVAAAIGLAGCGSDDSSVILPTPTATSGTAATRTATRTTTLVATIPATNTRTATAGAATATPTTGSASALSGLVVVRQDLSAAAGDSLGSPPAEWSSPAQADRFDRALSHARWRLLEEGGQTGTTGDDGRFRIEDLVPGVHELELSKTLNGNLISTLVDFTVGADGGADLVVEIGPGVVRWTATHHEGDVVVTETRSPNGSHVILRDGQITSLGATGRSYEDPDGDGQFAPEPCQGAPGAWICSEDNKCGDDRACRCAGSCPLCEDCPVSVCVPPLMNQPYACSAEGTCANVGDRCVCVSSCPECDDCRTSVCVPGTCDPSQIAGLSVYGPTRLIVGQSGSMSAVARFSDGWTVDATHLVSWASSDATIVTVDAWGGLVAHAAGSATITATLGDLTSDSWSIEVAVRPALKSIYLQNSSCYYPIDDPDIGPGAGAPRPLPDDSFPPPPCRQVVRIGGSISFFALGQFDDGYYEDVTNEVTWDLTPAGVVTVERGVVTGAQTGTVQVAARLGEIVSNGTEVRVVDRPTIISLQIHPLAAVPVMGPPRPEEGNDAAIPCYDCGYTVTILRGDVLPFQAVAAYDTGEWENVTDRVAWISSNATDAPISSAGVLTATNAGETIVRATLEGETSNDVSVRAVAQATLVSLSILQEGYDRVVAKSDQAFFQALGYYDVGFQRDATDSASWKSSDESIGGFSAAGTFVGRSAGTVEVWAEADGVESNRISIEVFQTSNLGYCDENNINRVEWSDAFNRVVLESDCALYEHPDVSTLRFTVTERERPLGIFDPCLDLFVYQGDRLVRTIREEGCGEPFLRPGAPEFDEAAVRYQTLAFWDLKDDRGSPVAPGSYNIVGRFYLYYDPVVSLNVVVQAPDGRIPCEQNACGNGCGIVHACGASLPVACPTVCVSLCDCPAGWGITPNGDCEPCPQECCPTGSACLPGTPTCEPPPVCCPEGQACIPELPPCESRCCPLGTICDALGQESCDCCPPGAQCAPGVRSCHPTPWCCPKGALCIVPAPPCEEDCCPPGAQCADNLIACEDLMCCRPDGTCDPAQPSCN